MATETSCGAHRVSGNIVIADESALFFHLHTAEDTAMGTPIREFTLAEGYAGSSEELSRFNTQHPLFGGEPVSVLVPERRLRMCVGGIDAKLCTLQLPINSVMRLRDGLYIASPELTFLRLANGRSEASTAEIGMNLCARYYLNASSDNIEDRPDFLTTPDELQSFLEEADGARGCRKAKLALRWVLPNSGSPMETKMAVLFRLPLGKGGFALPFDAMNYDVRTGRHTRVSDQSWYCIDMVSKKYQVGMEYDGLDYHLDKMLDIRRRNALLSIGWEIFPLGKDVLFDADATEKLGYQVAKRMGIRIQKPKSWESKYAKLRNDLGLPS